MARPSRTAASLRLDRVEGNDREPTVLHPVNQRRQVRRLDEERPRAVEVEPIDARVAAQGRLDRVHRLGDVVVAGDGRGDLVVDTGGLQRVLKALVALGEVLGAENPGEDGDPLLPLPLHRLGVHLAGDLTALEVVRAHVGEALAVGAVRVEHDHGHASIDGGIDRVAHSRAEARHHEPVDLALHVRLDELHLRGSIRSARCRDLDLDVADLLGPVLHAGLRSSDAGIAEGLEDRDERQLLVSGRGGCRP